ncbi:MAG: polyphosphate polymerase domain-containing protein [Lachnospiraceae bacterium]|nr:polyphosphate polymerase domain-containing protein [Lachnospiraceae bacterium]
MQKEILDLKYRNEMKFVCSEQELCLIEHRIKGICSPDAHAGSNGTYMVRSLYFDDYNDSCLYDNIDGILQREKFRIRIYNANPDYPVLECKQKYKDKNHKFSCSITRVQLQEMLEGGFALPEEAPEVLRKFYLQYHTRLLRPKVIVQYERTPFVYPIGNVRITFDRNVSGTADIMEFEKESIALRPVMSAGQHILEVKYDELLPDYIYNALQLGSLRQTAFSKYYMCRKMC